MMLKLTLTFLVFAQISSQVIHLDSMNGIQRRFLNSIVASKEMLLEREEFFGVGPRAGGGSKTRGANSRVKTAGKKQAAGASTAADTPSSDVGKRKHGVERGAKNLSDSELLSELFEDIFSNYHKELVPKRPTYVKMDLLLMRVKSTIEKEGIFESVIALLIEWSDQRLRWNPLDYANVSVLAFDSDKVWLPDIAMTNSADHLYGISKDTRFVIRVMSDGTMKFVPTGTSKTWCDLKLLTFPFDIQTCGFEFESWALDSATMTFNKSSDALVDDAFASPQWALCNHKAYIYQHVYEFSGEAFTRLRFDFTVRRKPTFYLINLIFPCATLSAIQLLVFTISSTDTTSDRVGFGTTNLLTLVVFQTIITQEMPKSSDSVTALSKYVIGLIIISSIGILQSVVVERILRNSAIETRPPSHWILVISNKIPLIWEPQLPTGMAQLLLSQKVQQQKEEKKKSDEQAAMMTVKRLLAAPSNAPTTLVAFQDAKKPSQNESVTAKAPDMTTPTAQPKPDEENQPAPHGSTMDLTSEATQHTGPIFVENLACDDDYTEDAFEFSMDRDSLATTTYTSTGITERVVVTKRTVPVKWRSSISPIFAMQKNKAESQKARKSSSTSVKSASTATTSSSRKTPAGTSSPPVAAALQQRRSTRPLMRGASDISNSSFARAFSRVSEFLFERHHHRRHRSKQQNAAQQQHHFSSVMIENARQWGIVVTKFDIVSLMACAICAISLPLFIFGPLAFDDTCPMI